jgi:hypothetical protein
MADGLHVMETDDYKAHLTAWANERGLTESNRVACGHGLIGVQANSRKHVGDHIGVCVRGRSFDLLDHATLWSRNGRPSLLIATCFRPHPRTIEHEAWDARLQAYCRRLYSEIVYYVLPRGSFPIYGEAATVVYARNVETLRDEFGLTITKSGALDRRAPVGGVR